MFLVKQNSSCWRATVCQIVDHSLRLVRRHGQNKLGRKTALAPAIASLPPTDEAFLENVLRAYLQVAIWLHALDMHPPTLEPTDYGWTKEGNSNILTPTTVSSGVAMVPDELLKLIRCSCRSELPCNTNKCTCKRSSMPCTVFCGCRGKLNCCNAEVDDDLKNSCLF